jgi:uncharacterized protein YdcH (DUF465 family)
LTHRKDGLAPLNQPDRCRRQLRQLLREAAIMGHLPRELHEDFPNDAGKIHLLKSSDTHFAELAETYHELNHIVHRMETGLEPVADHVLEDAKKLRLQAKDRIADLLARV